MLLLDTDHISVLGDPSSAGLRLLTRNVKDFEHVPGLRIANWLDDF